jgi:hypothetical protein
MMRMKRSRSAPNAAARKNDLVLVRSTSTKRI